MRILNKLVSVVLCLVLLSNIAITVLAEEPTNNVKDLITYRVPVISNEYTDKTVTFYEYQEKYYLDIEDIKNFTRSTISETDSKIVITHGIRELEIDKSTGHLIDSTVYDQGVIPFLAYEGNYLCEGIPMLMYLGAACTIRDGVALEVLMPPITIWESIMPDYLDYYFNITELYGGEDNVKISLICDILSDVLDGVSGHGLFADGDTHLEDALFEILEIDMMKYASVQEAVAAKNQDINDFLSSDAVGTLLEGGSNATDTVSEVLDYYADFYLETEILKNNIRWQHSYNVGDIDSASQLSKQINSQVYEQSSIKANLGTYENLADLLDLGMIAFDTAVTSYSLMKYDNDTKSLFARTINNETFNYVGYNEISWTNVSNRISNKLSSNEAIIASTAVENLTEYVAGELAEGGTIQALSAFTSKANIYVAATQIATFVSSLINRDLHEAYSADMNAIWLSAVQYDIARLTTQVLLKSGEEEKFLNVESIEKLKDMLTLYYRTTIAFSENIAVSIDEFGNKNKDEWIKYFSSTTDASVANYAAQYLYRITNCTIVPIVEFNTLEDVVLNSEWIENFESNFDIVSDEIVLKNNKNIKMVHTSGSYIYFFQTSESNYNDLYCLNLDNREVRLVDKNIVSDNLQLDNGYLYYTKSTDLMYKQSFRRIEISEKAEPEDVIAVNNGISVKGSKIINSNSYVCDDYFYNGSWYSGNLYYYIYRYDSTGNVKMLCDYIFPVTNMTVYKSNLYFDGINLNEDGIYTVPINGGSYKTLYKGSANIVSITDDRIFFSTGTNSEGVIDLQYIPVNGGSAKKLIDGKIENIIVCDNWVYYIDKDDSHQLKRVNISSNNVQNLTEGACKNFLVNNDNSILYYLSEYSDETQILIISIGNQTTHIDEEPSKPTINADDILGKYKIENYHGMDEYCPNFTLLNNNTFTFEINNFSGMYTINGTYTFDGVVLTLNAYDGADKVVFEVKGKDRLLFMNDMLGDTYYGDVFVKESNP